MSERRENFGQEFERTQPERDLIEEELEDRFLLEQTDLVNAAFKRAEDPSLVEEIKDRYDYRRSHDGAITFFIDPDISKKEKLDQLAESIDAKAVESINSLLPEGYSPLALDRMPSIFIHNDLLSVHPNILYGSRSGVFNSSGGIRGSIHASSKGDLPHVIVHELVHACEPDYANDFERHAYMFDMAREGVAEMIAGSVIEPNRGPHGNFLQDIGDTPPAHKSIKSIGPLRLKWHLTGLIGQRGQVNVSKWLRLAFEYIETKRCRWRQPSDSQLVAAYSFMPSFLTWYKSTQDAKISFMSDQLLRLVDGKPFDKDYNAFLRQERGRLAKQEKGE